MRRWLSLVVALASAVPVAAVAGSAQRQHRVARAGDVFEYLLPGSALGWTLAMADWRGLGQFAGSFGLTMGVTQLMKATIDATRPNGGPKSMPSGHTASATGGAAYMQRRYGWAFGVPYYIAAGYTALSRVVTDWHYPRDVVVGGAIAIGSSFLFVRRIKITDRYSLLPYGHGLYGLRIQRRF
ncbi:MAG: phosphatase PAP2 family protein [Candidatus Dadabacteria bacterium]|nr:MAG: phosphatase PAP2 family protein [Candidatus Dadabacteria bacterium]